MPLPATATALMPFDKHCAFLISSALFWNICSPVTEITTATMTATQAKTTMMMTMATTTTRQTRMTAKLLQLLLLLRSAAARVTSTSLPLLPLP
jgi:carbohydrate-binding DOMON domain-containing protein